MSVFEAVVTGNPSRWLQRVGVRVPLIAVPLILVTVQVFVNYETGQLSDLSHLYLLHHLKSQPFPYTQARIEYPVLTGLYMTAAAAVTHGMHTYMRVSAVGLWLCAVGCTLVLWRWRPKAAWCFACCPLLLVYSVLNWDLLAIFLMLLGWYAWTKERYAQAGLWFALGTFAKLYPVFLFAFCLVELIRRRRHLTAGTAELARYLGAFTLTAAVVNVPFMIAAYRNWRYFWVFSFKRNEHADLLAWIGLLGHASTGATNAVLSGVVIVAALAGAVAIWRGHRTEHVTALVFFVFMLMQKVYSPQYTLWLAVFALVADWDLWTLAALSLMGLAAYGNAVTHIALVQQRQHFVHWYNSHISGLAQCERLMTILAVLLATAARPVTRRLHGHRVVRIT